MAFTATQSISTLQCEFCWRARVGPFGLLSVCDALGEAGGRLDVPARRTDALPGRAELPWAPDAILRNAHLRWREVGPERLAVSAGSGDTSCKVVLSLDAQGRIAGAFAPDRPQSAVPPYPPTPWVGGISDYRQENGRWIPFAGEVAWEIEGKPVCYWQGRIKKWHTGPVDQALKVGNE